MAARKRCVRPRRLRVKGYTAFVEEADVDFDGLDLFAITGPTGAGKTSLLQAMTIALYGRAPKLGDDLRQLISPAAERAEFSFEFLAHGRRYRIGRVMFRARPTAGGPRGARRRRRVADAHPGRPRGERPGGADPRARLRQLHQGRPAAPERVRRVPARQAGGAALDPHAPPVAGDLRTDPAARQPGGRRGARTRPRSSRVCSSATTPTPRRSAWPRCGRPGRRPRAPWRPRPGAWGRSSAPRRVASEVRQRRARPSLGQRRPRGPRARPGRRPRGARDGGGRAGARRARRPGHRRAARVHRLRR